MDLEGSFRDILDGSCIKVLDGSMRGKDLEESEWIILFGSAIIIPLD
jgi:hypothetical protein